MIPVVSNDLCCLFFCVASAKRQYRRIFFDVFSISSFKIVKEKERAYGDVLSCGEAETLGFAAA